MMRGNMKGFLNTWAGFSADLNLVIQLAMGGCLIMGALLAQAKHYTAHAICQTTVVILNLALIATIMGPAFEQQVVPGMPAHMGKLHYSIAALHGALGFATELLGLYILLVAGTNVLPQRWRFSRWKLLMRVELILWWAVIILGAVTYYVWYAGRSLH